jgi:hypothetical protein
MKATPTLSTRPLAVRDAWLARLGPARATALLLAALAVPQLVLAGHLGLITDEAHYALYGLHLDWSYFDHPPLVGWLQALVLTVASGELALRLWAIVLSAASGALLYRLVRRLFPDESPWTACVAVALWATSPIVHFTGIALVPEDVLLPAALLVMHALVSVLRWGSLRQWLLLGAALGLAGLAKYTAASLVVGVAGALLLSHRARDLRGPGPWLAMAVAALLVAPVVLWNASHDWVSFRYQLHHGTAGRSWSVVNFLESRAGELLAYGPALVIGGLAGGWEALRRERAEPGVRLALLLAVPVLLLFWPPSGRELTLPHWTQLLWVALAVLAARWYLRGWARAARRRLLLTGGTWCALALLALHLVGLGLGPADPVGLLRAPVTGWERAAATAVRLRDGLPSRPGPAPVLFIDHWTKASRLAWYARPAAVQVLGQRRTQFDLWFGKPAAGARGILVAWDSPGPPDPLEDLARFEHVRLLEEQPVEERGGRIATFRFWECDGFRP